ncbi:hypothetical protein LTR22_028422 [Elasticomyces elasticus]|nr:hypothetical protein LTR22_028422 [Elasticomyces elasticus]
MHLVSVPEIDLYRMVDICIYIIEKAPHEENFGDILGLTALTLAAEVGLAKVVKALKKKAEDGIIDINAVCKENHMTALQYAVQYTLAADPVDNKELGSKSAQHNATEGYETIAALLSIRGIDVNKGDCVGVTALEFAVSKGNVRVVKTLLKHENMKISPDLLLSSAKNSRIHRLLCSYKDDHDLERTEAWFPSY